MLILYFKNVYVDKYYISITVYWLEMFPKTQSVFSVLREKNEVFLKGSAKTLALKLTDGTVSSKLASTVFRGFICR